MILDGEWRSIMDVKTMDAPIRNYLPSLNATIPNFQRSYEWGNDQIEDFLEDLYSEVQNKHGKGTGYFFGPIITTEETESGKKQIIDGQQRLTTTTIFLAVIRDFMATFENNDAQEIKYMIIHELIGDGSEFYKFKLTQTGDIANYFEKNIQNYQEIDKLEPKKVYVGKAAKGKGKINNLIRAYNQILESLNEQITYIDDEVKKVEKLKSIFNVFINRFFVVEISSSYRTEAFQIFQTINARGIDLSAADLIKSDFFGNSGENTEIIVSSWDNIQKTLGNLDLTDFIRYVWNSKYPFVTKRSLYKVVSKKITDAEKVKEFTEMLGKLAAGYTEMNGDNDEKFLTDSDVAMKIRNTLEESNELGFKIYAPIYLALLNSDFSEENIYNVMKVVSRVLIRNKILSQGTNWLEKLLSFLAGEITNSTKTEEETTQYILGRIKGKTPSTDKTRQVLLGYDFSSDLKLVRFILRAIENNKDGEKSFVSTDNKKVHIEHIMPQQPIELDSWGVDQNLHEKYVWKLGNLTLWFGKSNSGAGNCEFNKKKAIYEKSDLGITREIVNYPGWNPDNIDERTQKIIDEFLSL